MSAADTSSTTGFTIAVSVLSVVVVAAIIGFIVIATMPKPVIECIQPIQPVIRPANGGGGGGGGEDRGSGGVRNPVGNKGGMKGAAADMEKPVLGGAGIQAPPPALPPLAPAHGPAHGPAHAPSGSHYQDGVTMQPPVMDLMHRAANAAYNVNQRSMQQATTPSKGTALATVTSMTPPGGGDEERRLGKVPAAALNLDNSGYIPQVIAHAGGPAMAHTLPTSIMAAAFGADVPEDGNLYAVDPESAAQLDKALALSGVPASFGLDMDSYERRKAAEIIRTMELTGAADPSLEQVMAASTPFIATQGLLKRSTDAQGAIDRSVIIEPPMRFLYQNPGYRMSTPGITMSPVVTEGGSITPAQEYYLLQTGCFDGQCSTSAKQEPF
jgi:hypothetical protein